MKSTVKKIHRALNDLYQLDVPHDPTNYLLKRPVPSISREMQGGLVLRTTGNALTVGIYFHPEIKNTLLDFPLWIEGGWSKRQENAFATAVEEISHFLYLLYHTGHGRAVTQFELELQGEIDKFLLLFFADTETPKDEKFTALLETLFNRFRWANGLSPEEKTRYIDAHNYAKTFLLQIGDLLKDSSSHDKTIAILRKFYRMGLQERIGYLHSKS